MGKDGTMKKTKKWYNGNRGLVIGRSRLEAYQAGQLNSKNKVISCHGCGKDTTNTDCLCDECSTERTGQ